MIKLRRIFEFFGGFALIAFSFYFTDKVSLLVASKSDLMQEIKAVSTVYKEEPVDAVIKDNTIIPGKFGREVNSEESYLEMHDFGSFNENYLVYNYIKPQKSLLDNKDKFITSGNPQNRRISLIIIDNDEVQEYLEHQQIPYDLVLTTANFIESSRAEVINGAKNKDDFKKINNKLKKENKICLKNYSDIDLCKKYSYFLIDTNLKVNSTNLINIKNNIAPGNIILLNTGARVEDVKYILNEINYKDLEIVNISVLINEKESTK